MARCPRGWLEVWFSLGFTGCDRKTEGIANLSLRIRRVRPELPDFSSKSRFAEGVRFVLEMAGNIFH